MTVHVVLIDPLLDLLVRDDACPHEGDGADCHRWLKAHRAYCAERFNTAGHELATWPFARAVLAGFKAERVAHAFIGGYQAALGALSPAVEDAIALCATEDSGAHPRAIKCHLRATDSQTFELNGSKRWVSAIERAGSLIVIASEGEREGGQLQLRAVRVRADQAGVSFQAMAPTPFVPEILHAKLHFEAVSVDASAVLPGDGYLQYLKPFRTIEDIHVQAAIAAYLLAIARRAQWLPVHVQRLLSMICGLAALAQGDFLSPAKHLALDGIFEQFAANIAGFESCWSQVDVGVAERWNRDRALLLVAHQARALRTEAALRALG